MNTLHQKVIWEYPKLTFSKDTDPLLDFGTIQFSLSAISSSASNNANILFPAAFAALKLPTIPATVENGSAKRQVYSNIA